MSVKNGRRYAPEFREAMVRRMLGPPPVSAHAIFLETGVAPATLLHWLHQARSLRFMTKDERLPRARGLPAGSDRPPSEKLRLLTDAMALPDADLGVFLRTHGLHEADLKQWRTAVLRALDEGPPPDPGAARRVVELERELRVKDKALAETTAILVLRGKLQALLGEEGANTQQSSGSPSSASSTKRSPQAPGSNEPPRKPD